PPLDLARPLFQTPADAPAWKRLAHAGVRGAATVLAGRQNARQAWYPYLNLLVTTREGSTS
ncbi:MAG TPA: hypothetical protein VN972_03495, partial [Methylomirabilota bacterium]|nr:hypothetical protein [Methylomirabilota bacterium]